jgi:acetylornithine deacetylase/succinyl-diaminopimelate desuccinylase-like protein
MELVRLVASMKDATGRVLIPGFYDGTREVSGGDERAIAQLPDDDEALRVELGLGSTEGETLARQLLLPSLNIRGLSGGAVGDAAANVIPTSATASFDIRLAPGNDPVAIMDRVVDHILSQGWHVVDEEPSPETRLSHPKVARVTRRPSYPGVRMDTDSALARALLGAARSAADEPVVAVPTFGGSVPLHHFVTILDAPVAITPFANHDNNQHAANENLRLANLWYGIDLMAALMTMQLPATSSSQA